MEFLHDKLKMMYGSPILSLVIERIVTDIENKCHDYSGIAQKRGVIQSK